MTKIKIGIYKIFEIDRYDMPYLGKKNALDLKIKFKVLPNISVEIIKRAESRFYEVIFRIEWLFWHIPITIIIKSNE